jgi:hypothetical protein
MSYWVYVKSSYKLTGILIILRLFKTISSSRLIDDNNFTDIFIKLWLIKLDGFCSVDIIVFCRDVLDIFSCVRKLF